MPLGIATESAYQTTIADLSIGDSLILYTDGITEASNSADQLYGVAALQEIAFTHRRSPPAKLAAACLDDVRTFQNGESQSDDVTLMIVRRTDLH